VELFCGIDWAEHHHDVALVDGEGTLLARRRITDDAAGFAALLEMLGEHGDAPEHKAPVAMETGRVFWSRPCATCSTASSASFTTASPSTSPTTTHWHSSHRSTPSLPNITAAVILILLRRVGLDLRLGVVILPGRLMIWTCPRCRRGRLALSRCTPGSRRGSLAPSRGRGCWRI